MSDFWAERRKAVEAEQAEEIARALEAAEAAERAEIEALPDAEVLERLGLPDPASVASGGDAAAFMAREVPRRIRNRALRSLWRSNPVLANLDGLNDYDDDYTGNGLAGGALKTSYEVGRGLTAHLRHVAEAAERTAEAPPDTAAEAAPETVSDENARVNAPQAIDDKPLAEEPPDVKPSLPGRAQEEAPRPEAELRTRMRFTFEEEDRQR